MARSLRTAKISHINWGHLNAEDVIERKALDIYILRLAMFADNDSPSFNRVGSISQLLCSLST